MNLRRPPSLSLRHIKATRILRVPRRQPRPTKNRAIPLRAPTIRAGINPQSPLPREVILIIPHLALQREKGARLVRRVPGIGGERHAFGGCGGGPRYGVVPAAETAGADGGVAVLAGVDGDVPGLVVVDFVAGVGLVGR